MWDHIFIQVTYQQLVTNPICHGSFPVDVTDWVCTERL